MTLEPEYTLEPQEAIRITEEAIATLKRQIWQRYLSLVSPITTDEQKSQLRDEIEKRKATVDVFQKELDAILKLLGQ